MQASMMPPQGRKKLPPARALLQNRYVVHISDRECRGSDSILAVWIGVQSVRVMPALEELERGYLYLGLDAED